MAVGVRRAVRDIVASATVVYLAAAIAPMAQASFPGADGRIAFSAYSSTSPNSQIYSVEPDGSGLEQLTNAGVNKGAAYSADGRRLVFERTARRQYDLYTMAADGGDERQLTSTPDRSETWGSFSPSGRRIVFDGTRHGCVSYPGCKPAIYVMNADGSHQRRLTRFGYKNGGSEPEFAPNGRRIVFTRSRRRFNRRDGRYMTHSAIWTMRPDGSHKRAVTRWAKGHPPGVGQYSPDYSPRGTRIAYESVFGCNSLCITVVRSIRADGTGTHRTIYTKRYGVTYAPAGYRFAYRHGDDIFTLSLVSREQRRVTDHQAEGIAGVDIRPGAWQPRHGSDL
jgi:Tol biopolymer transport system component